MDEYEPDVDQLPCVACGTLYREHDRDGLGECEDCSCGDFHARLLAEKEKT